MIIENEKLRKRIYEIEEELEKENNCKNYVQVLEKLNNNELLQLYSEKFAIGNSFNYNRVDVIKELDALNKYEQSF